MTQELNKNPDELEVVQQLARETVPQLQRVAIGDWSIIEPAKIVQRLRQLLELLERMLKSEEKPQ